MNRENITIEGLYWQDFSDKLVNGKWVSKNDEPVKRMPDNIYFGLDAPEIGLVGGNAYTHTYSGLHPVYLPSGERYRVPDLNGLSGKYNGEVIIILH